jgi:hypothetical protein
MAVACACTAVRLLQLHEVLELPQPASDTAHAPRRSAPKVTCAGVLDEAQWQVLWITQRGSRTRPLLQDKYILEELCLPEFVNKRKW